jgi:Uma2 family endonuclease
MLGRNVSLFEDAMTVATSGDDSSQRIVLYDVPWKSYLHLLREFRGRHLRITYDRGALEIMTLSLGHEKFSAVIALLIHVLALELNIAVCNAGSTTLKRRRIHRGLEPDKCFYIKNEPAIRNKQKLDLRVDPPPDLAIEVDVTRSSLNRQAIYAKLHVPELWRFDGRTLRVYSLDTAGKYNEVEQSLAFPSLPIKILGDFIARTGQDDDTTLMREFQVWVKNKLASGSHGTK